MRKWLWVVLGLLTGGCREDAGTFVVVRVEPAAAGGLVARLELDVHLGARAEHHVIDTRAAALPAEVVLAVGRGEGVLALSARALDATGAEIARGGAQVEVVRGGVAHLTLVLGEEHRDALLAGDRDSHDFGVVTLGGGGGSGVVVVSNVGGRSSGPLLVEVDGDASFVVAGCSGRPLAPGEDCRITVRFQAGRSGDHRGALLVNATPGGRVRVELRGVAEAPAGSPALAVGVAHVDFGDIEVGSTSPAAELRFSNLGDSSSPALTSVISGDSAQFSLVDACAGVTLAPSASCVVRVALAPSATGSFGLDVRVAGGSSTASAHLTGAGRRTGTIMVARAGTGSGRVTSLPAGIDCGAACSAALSSTTGVPEVSLTASPDASSAFTGWSGACAGTGPCMVRLDGSAAVTAEFTLKRYPLTFTARRVGPAGGRVTGPGIDCDAPCTVSVLFDHGTRVRLDRTSASGLHQWTGDCDGLPAGAQAADCQLTMDGPRVVGALFTGWNYVFVTSTWVSPHFDSGSAAQPAGDALPVADGICQQRARAAGLPGSYRAWLSVESPAPVHARERVSTARGFMRTDLRPVGDRAVDMVATTNALFFPIARDEFGNDARVPYWTGTTTEGIAEYGGTCASWTAPTGASGAAGSPLSGGGGFSASYSGGCEPGAGRPLLCFGIDLAQPMTITPAAGRRAFVSAGKLAVGSGRPAADALCRNEASAAGLGSSFAAFLTDSTSSAGDRFSATGAPWVRTDGIPLVSSALEMLLASPRLLAALNVHADGRSYLGPFDAVFTGAPHPLAPATENCSDWSSSMTTAITGTPTATGAAFFDSLVPNYCHPHPIYCLEQ